MPVKRPCVVAGCPDYVVKQGLSSRQRGTVHRCPTHEREHSKATGRARNARADTQARRDPAYLAIPKPYGMRCALRIENVCTGWATTWDHIVPLAKGGTHAPSNRQPACRECNSSKGAR
ncbi:HNH endonuclease [Mycobacterium kubicae]|uniref:HNH endonuclease n=1 Tax=Mycobacterium kubicae TaxID=120959 RepID=UPI0009ED0C8E